MKQIKKSIKSLTSQTELNDDPNTEFHDALFPHDITSIYSNDEKYKSKNPQMPQSFFPIEPTFIISQFSSLPKNENVKYTWQRISEIDPDYNIVQQPINEPLINDIIPGEIGNCYFTSALKFLSEVPKRILDIVDITKYANHTFRIMCYINGVSTVIILDDYIPMINDKIAFTRINPKSHSTWPLILEKAWAKVNSSYEDTISGNISDALHFLTPCPIKIFYHDIQYDNMYNKIAKAIDDGFIVCCDIHSTNDNILLRKLGVISNHAYKVLGHAELKDPKGKQFNLLKIYNPFNTTTWIGKWSPDSSMWTPEYKKFLAYDPDREKNVYWIEMGDYLKFYTTTYICFLHDDYHYKSEKITISGINDAFTCCKFSIGDGGINTLVPKNSTGSSISKDNFTVSSSKKSKNSKVIVKSSNSYIMVNFKNKRIQKNFKHKEGSEGIFCNLTLFKREGDKYRYVDSACGKEERMFIPITEFPNGEYVLAVNFPFHNSGDEVFKINEHFSINPSRPSSITVSIYSPIVPSMITITEFESDKFDKVILRSIVEKSRKNSHLYYFDKEKENDTSRSINFENERGAFGYLVLDNKSEGCLYESINFIEFSNVNLISFIIHNPSIPKKKNLLSCGIVETEDNLIEDINTRNYIKILSKPQYTVGTDESKVSPIAIPSKTENISNENPYEILLKVASMATVILIFEKCDEYSAVDIHSQIAFRYPLYVVLKETKNNSTTKTRLRYVDKEVEIYECIIEHSSGVVFYYKNKTHQMMIKVIVNFKEMNNLKFIMTSDDIGKRNIEEKSSITLVIQPGENKFIELRAKNLFEAFNYNFDMNYYISYAKLAN